MYHLKPKSLHFNSISVEYNPFQINISFNNQTKVARKIFQS